MSLQMFCKTQKRSYFNASKQHNLKKNSLSWCQKQIKYGHDCVILCAIPAFCVEKAHTIHKRMVNIQLNFRGKSAKSPLLFHRYVLQKSKIYNKGDKFNQDGFLK
jgi:hypothetical protein